MVVNCLLFVVCNACRFAFVMLGVVCWLVFAVVLVLFVAWCVLSGRRRVLLVVCCSVFAVCCLLSVVHYVTLLGVVRGCMSLFVVSCLVSDVCSVVIGNTSWLVFVGWLVAFLLFALYCVLRVVCICLVFAVLC